jgi:IS30 family transposase
VYVAKKAQHKARVRRLYAKYQAMKVVANRILCDYVESNLMRFWSPEDIAGRIKYIDRHIAYANKDSIYKYVKSVYGRQLEEFLWYKGRKRRPKAPRSNLKDRVFIDQRPARVGKRRFFWDWEADFIVSGKDGSGALLVLVERKSRYVLIFKLANRKVETINAVLKLVFGSGQLVCGSLTLDNDVVFRHHRQMSTIIGGPIFFCHPYHSWEKGSVEKINQLIRRFIKKGADIAKVPEQKIQWIQDILNNKPLKCLKFHTPKEVMANSTHMKKFIQKNTAQAVLANLQECSV